MPTQEMRALWHPTRARILELLKAEPATRSHLVEAAGAPFAEVAYHCRALCRSGCIQTSEASGPDSDDPLYEASSSATAPPVHPPGRREARSVLPGGQDRVPLLHSKIIE